MRSDLGSLTRRQFNVLSLDELARVERFALEAFCRGQAQSSYLGDHRALCRILGRYKFYLDTRDRGFASNVLLDGYWEMWLTIFIARHVGPGMIAVDVGANFGYYTLLLADLVGPEGHVFAIEPNPGAAAMLRHSVELNGFAARTSVIEAAAGAHEGRATLFLPHGEPKNATVVPAAAAIDPNRGTLHEVRQRDLDSLLRDQKTVDFVKIDAEGAEERIVEGMRTTIERCRPSIVLEFNAARSAAPGPFLEFFRQSYGDLCSIDYSGCAVPVSIDALLSTRWGEDWLLFLQGRRR